MGELGKGGGGTKTVWRMSGLTSPPFGSLALQGSLRDPLTRDVRLPPPPLRGSSVRLTRTSGVAMPHAYALRSPSSPAASRLLRSAHLHFRCG